jgi:geranylgeranyl pyrophosphate synthase
MEKYGSIEYSKKLAAKFAKEAIEIFDKEMQFIKREPFRSEIRAGIDFIVNRDH